jgi:pimeloyl-ACP methyl ester carboxylesterase
VSPHDGRSVFASDGRTLMVAEWGDAAGCPVFWLHGSPGSRFSRHYDESEYSRAGARVITYDRPGYGASDRDPGRRVVSCVGDVAAIADALGIERFAVTGGSGGGPHALAVAARLADRVTRAACSVTPAPYDIAGFDWFDGMDPENIRLTKVALEGGPTWPSSSNESVSSYFAPSPLTSLAATLWRSSEGRAGAPIGLQGHR